MDAPGGGIVRTTRWLRLLSVSAVLAGCSGGTSLAGDGSDDRDPDPSVPVVTPAAPPVEVVAADEAVAVRDDDLELVWEGALDGTNAMTQAIALPDGFR